MGGDETDNEKKQKKPPITYYSGSLSKTNSSLRLTNGLIAMIKTRLYVARKQSLIVYLIVVIVIFEFFRSTTIHFFLEMVSG